MRKIDLLFATYAESHRNATNKLIHWICVPLIFWTILGIISLIPSKSVCFIYIGCISFISLMAMVLVTVFYTRLSFLIGIMMMILMILMESFAYGVNTRTGNPWRFLPLPGSFSSSGIRSKGKSLRSCRT